MSDSSIPSSSNWYYAQDGNSIGPIVFAALQALHVAGQITDETYVVEEGGEKWAPYGALHFPAAKPLANPFTPSNGEPIRQKPALSKGEDSKAKKDKENKQAVQGCFGCMGLIVIIILVTVVFGKCSSFVGYKMQKTPEEKIEFLMHEHFGKRLRSVEYTSFNKSSATIEVHFNASDNFSANFIRLGIISDMRVAYKSIFTNNLSVKPTIVLLSAWLPTKDKYGKEGEGEFYRTSLTYDEAAKVKWDKDQSLDFTKIWNPVFIHPQLRESAD